MPIETCNDDDDQADDPEDPPGEGGEEGEGRLPGPPHPGHWPAHQVWYEIHWTGSYVYKIPAQQLIISGYTSSTDKVK